MLDIADGADDVIVGDDRSDSARVNAKKLRVDVRKWYISKVKPKKYGDKLDLTSDGERLVQEPMILSKIKPRKLHNEAETEATSSS